MELVRPIEQYPWRAIGSTVCWLAPIAAAVWFCPVWFHWESVYIVLWLKATLCASALCLSCGRCLATLGENSAEHAFQTFAVIAFPTMTSSFNFLNGGSTQGDGAPAAAMLLHDPAAVATMVWIAVSLLLLVHTKRRARLPSAMPPA